MSCPRIETHEEYLLDNCLCRECGVNAVNREDDVEVCDECKMGAI